MLGPPKCRDLDHPVLVSLFRRFFDAVVEQCADPGLVWGEEFYIDATKVQANSSLDSMKTRFAADEHLRNLFADADHENRYGSDEPIEQEHCSDDVVPAQLPVDPPPDLEEHNSTRHDLIADGGELEREVQHGSYRRVADFQMSTTDPDATLMRARRGGVLQLGYHDHYLTDGGRARIILRVMVAPSELMENQVMLDLLWQTCFRWQLWPDQIAGDTTYGTLENIIPIEDPEFAMYTPLPDWDKRTTYFGVSHFAYDRETDTYRCPTGQTLRRETVKDNEGRIVY